MSQKRTSGHGDPIIGGASKKAKKSSFIPLPGELAQTGAVVNVRNTDDEECFKWSVLAALHQNVQEPENVHSYLDCKESRMFDKLTFPMNKKDIPQFERLNSIGVNLFGYDADSKTIFPDLVNNENQEKAVDLLYIANDDTAHYSWIKNFSALMGDTRKHYCRCCLEGFDEKERQQSHTRLCRLFEPRKVEFPSGDNAKLSDKYPDFILLAPYVIYADFECIQPKAQGSSDDDNESSLERLTDHQPSGYAYKVVGPEGEVPRPVKVYRGENVVDRFMQDMDEEKKWIKKQLSQMRLKPSNLKQTFTPNCLICQGEFTYDKKFDYLSPTSEYRGKICWKCNKNYNEQVIVVFQNLANYDGHFIMADKKTAENKCTFCIAPSIDKYLSFTIGALRFIDSLSFLKDSLLNLVSNLAADDTSIEVNFKHTYGLHEVKCDIDKLHLLVRKQVYPYDYMDSTLKFQETSLPDKKHFRNTLNDEDISEEDYQHAENVWKEFKIKNLGEYHDLYVKSDVVLLADVFENFRKMCKKEYSLDPAYFYSLAGLSWQAALKQTKPDLDLFTDREMYLMIESGIRGGVAMISQRFAKANNQLLPDDYDSTKPKTYIIYLDANNLYGWAMSQYLPTGGFKWLTPEEIEEFEINDKQIDAKIGYILEVDLEYPKELHGDHNDYPLAPDKIEITHDMLSPFAKKLFTELSKKESSKPKLVPNLRDKNKYVVHYRTLQLYLKLGLKLTEIHRVVSFEQSVWLETYIDFNTKRREKAKNKSDSDMFKLMNNSFFGKTFENIRKYRDVKFVTNETEVKKHASQLNCEETKSFSGELTAVLMKKIKITLNKPIYIGFSVLELSKMFIYIFHYNFIRNKYKDKAKLLFTDTDSMCYEIETEDVYNDMLKELEAFDISEYTEGHRLHSNENKKIVGKMTDETHRVPIAEFVGLKPKMYSLKFGGNGKKCAVGVDKNYRERKVSHDDYKECLDNREETEIEQVKITNIGHQVHTVRERRVGLSPYDDKRYVLDNGTHTFAYGHKCIPLAVETSSGAGTVTGMLA